MTPTDHIDHQNLLEAEEKVKSVLEGINSLKRSEEMEERILNTNSIIGYLTRYKTNTQKAEAKE
jgi:hypothetical protein